MRPALPHVKHVQKPVTPVVIIAREILKWNNAKNCAGLALTLAANVPKNAEA